MNFDRFSEDTPRNAFIIRAALKDMDYKTCAMALVMVPDDFRQLVYRNISKETAGNIRIDVERYAKNTSKDRLEAACEMLEGLLSQYDEQTDEIDETFTRPINVSELSPIRLDTKRDIVSTFVSLAKLTRERSLLALEDVAPTISDPVAAKGLSMIVSGYDPPDVLMILERMKQTQIRLMEEKYSMIIDGIESLQAGDHPTFISSKLEAHIAE